jgi:hypothetical protein
MRGRACFQPDESLARGPAPLTLASLGRSQIASALLRVYGRMADIMKELRPVRLYSACAALLITFAACAEPAPDSQGGRAEVSREDILDPPKSLGDASIESETPAYHVLDTVDMMPGGRYGEILIASYSRQTSAVERESTLRTIMARENLSRADLYCSEDAAKANSSSSYAASHPDALKTCFLGSIQDGVFTPGEAVF